MDATRKLDQRDEFAIQMLKHFVDKSLPHSQQGRSVARRQSQAAAADRGVPEIAFISRDYPQSPR